MACSTKLRLLAEMFSRMYVSHERRNGRWFGWVGGDMCAQTLPGLLWCGVPARESGEVPMVQYGERARWVGRATLCHRTLRHNYCSSELTATS
jgi:hypothetical protein